MSRYRKLTIDRRVWDLLEAAVADAAAETHTKGDVSAETDRRCEVLFEVVYRMLPCMDRVDRGQSVEPVANAHPPWTQYVLRYQGLTVVYLASPTHVIALTAGWTTDARTVCNWVDEDDIARAVAGTSA